MNHELGEPEEAGSLSEKRSDTIAAPGFEMVREVHERYNDPNRRDGNRLSAHRFCFRHPGAGSRRGVGLIGTRWGRSLQ
jgi:hypothetical protein